MNKFAWKISSFIYKILGPKNAWRIAMSPLAKLIIDLIISYAGNKEIMVVSRHGIKFLITLEEYLYTGFLHLGETNPQETSVLRKILKKGDVFIDIGAYKGWYSLNAASVVESQGKIYAFEPNPSVAVRLEENCRLNKFKNINIHKVALLNISSTKPFWIGSEDMLGSLKKNHVEQHSKSKLKKINIVTDTLDKFCKTEKIKQIKLIKIDVEGEELRVIKGAKNTLNRYRPYLILEVFGLSADLDKKRSQKIINYLAKLKYKPYEFIRGHLRRYSNLNSEPGIINLFFARDNKELSDLHLLNLDL